MIELNYTNCLKNVVGEEGLSWEELEGIKQKAKTAYEAVEVAHKSNKLGFIDLPDQDTKPIKLLVQKLKSKYDNFVVIGIGGSALGNIALQSSLREPFWNMLDKKSRKGYFRLFVADNVDPLLLHSLLNVLDLKKTVINVISKSGDTAECLANFFILKKKLLTKVGKKYHKQIIITTGPKGYLREVALREKLVTFTIPENVGGRFSVFSPVGLLSAAFTGINIDKLLSGAGEMRRRCQTSDIMTNPALMYAVIQYLFYIKGKKICVMLPYSNGLYGIADWFRQLWAESLGKKYSRDGQIVNIGPTPIKALGVTDQHSQLQLYIEGPYDKIITFLSIKEFTPQVKIPVFDPTEVGYLGGHTLNELLKAEEEATRIALTKQGRVNCTITLPKICETAISEVMFMLELATAYIGELFNINAFDQPGVELGKQLTYAMMGRKGFEQKRTEIEQEKPQQYLI